MEAGYVFTRRNILHLQENRSTKTGFVLKKTDVCHATRCEKKT